MNKIKLMAVRFTLMLKGEEVVGSVLRTDFERNSTSSGLIELRNGKRTNCKDVRFPDGSFAFVK